MNKGILVKVDEFNRAMHDMSRKLGNSATQQQIVESEVRKILETAISRTKAASVEKIREFNQDDKWMTYHRKKYLMTNRYPDPLWNRLIELRKKDLVKKLAARGWSKASWYALGIAIGFDLKAPGFVKSSKVPGVSAAQNVSAAKENTRKGNYGLRIENNSPMLGINNTNSSRAFFSAVAGRIGFYRRNVQNGVFKDLKSVAAKYPGIVLTPKQ